MYDLLVPVLVFTKSVCVGHAHIIINCDLLKTLPINNCLY